MSPANEETAASAHTADGRRRVDPGRRRRTIVLCYHAISDEWPAPLAVSQGDFHRQIRAFLQRGFRPATFVDAVLGPSRGKTVAITFDDAYRSVFDRAFPVLAALGARATLFVPTGLAGDGALLRWPGIDHWIGGPWEAELESATWSQVGELAAAGWEIGSHSRSHPRLTSLPDAELVDELRGSQADCERKLGASCRSIAYPYGDVDDRVADAARDAGYIAGASLPDRLEAGVSAPDAMRWPRIGVYPGDNRLRLGIKADLLRRAPRAWALAHAARRWSPLHRAEDSDGGLTS
jgi:peptidoglycan/xylan/chitin deacetylase (PgdA/CDA1 family)